MIRHAPESQLESMWNSIVFLLGIKVDLDEMDIHIETLSVLNNWILEQYGDKLTVEEVLLAYDMACTRKLAIDELFSILSPKHVGIVLSAYNHFVTEDLEINKVFKQQLLHEEPKQTDEQITQFMKYALDLALDEVRKGKQYVDAGNGLFHWLWDTGRLIISQQDQEHYLQRAISDLPDLIRPEKRGLVKDPTKLEHLDKLLQYVIDSLQPRDYVARVQTHAKRLALNDYLRHLLRTQPQHD